MKLISVTPEAKRDNRKRETNGQREEDNVRTRQFRYVTSQTRKLGMVSELMQWTCFCLMLRSKVRLYPPFVNNAILLWHECASDFLSRDDVILYFLLVCTLTNRAENNLYRNRRSRALVGFFLIILFLNTFFFFLALRYYEALVAIIPRGRQLKTCTIDCCQTVNLGVWCPTP